MNFVPCVVPLEGVIVRVCQTTSPQRAQSSQRFFKDFLCVLRGESSLGYALGYFLAAEMFNNLRKKR
jgi:hypothetical protein